MDTTNLGLSERQLKRQGLECLVSILKSLVVWGTVEKPLPSAEPQDTATLHSMASDEVRKDALSPEPSTDRLSMSMNQERRLSMLTMDLPDDPTKFENAKQKKTTLMEGVKKFNTKPKAVRILPCIRFSLLMHYDLVGN
jgi:brefeldin A-inhibited guanine nucleotide-exchange protein